MAAPAPPPPSFQAHMTRFGAQNLTTNHCLRAKTAPPLIDLCLRLLANSFTRAPRPSLRGIPPRLVDKFVELLPPDLPLDVSAHLIANESYWKRAANAIWPICDVSDHGSSWKRLFFEKTVAEFLESFDPAKTEMAELARILSLAKDYIFSLRLRHFPAHVDVELLFQKIPTLANLEMTYGVKNVGLEYRRELFGMPPADAVSLSRALRVTETLTILALPCNVLDDATTRLLADGLHDNSTVTSLDLSHNRISDRGVKAIAKALGDGSVISHLNLSDNLIHADGGRHLGRALTTNTSLEVLNLRLNRLCDNGGIRLLEGLLKNQALANLNLASNAVGLGTARALCAVLEQCASLRALDLGGNELSDEAGVLLLEVLGRNKSLAQIDLRANDVLADTAASIDELCTANAEKARVEAMRGALDVYH